MGLTWIDHDTIDNPVEEMSVGKGVAEDVEFTVETLGGAAGGTAPGASTASANAPSASSASGHPGGGMSNNSLQANRRESLISKKVVFFS